VVGMAGMRSVFGVAFLTLLGILCLVSCVFVNYQISILRRKVRRTELSLCNSILNASSLLGICDLRPIVLLGFGL
jgi:hypothetical protein